MRPLKDISVRSFFFYFGNILNLRISCRAKRVYNKYAIRPFLQLHARNIENFNCDPPKTFQTFSSTRKKQPFFTSPSLYLSLTPLLTAAEYLILTEGVAAGTYQLESEKITTTPATKQFFNVNLRKWFAPQTILILKNLNRGTQTTRNSTTKKKFV